MSSSVSRKELASSFLQLAGTGNVEEAYEKYVAQDFKHHNQYFKGDRQSLLDAMASAHKASPNKSVEVKHSYEDGDTIITHSLVTRSQADAQPIAVVHIFKFNKDNRVVELWDVGQELIKDSPNTNGPF